MKLLLVTAQFFALLVLAAPSVWAADSISVGASLPMSYSFDAAKDGGKLQSNGLSGMLLTATLPIVGTFGVETYDVGLKDNGDAKLSLLIVDYIFVFPIPFVNIGVGAGIGTANLKGGTYATEYSRATASQWLLQIGIPLIAGVNLDYGYHSVTARPKYTSKDYYLEASGTMSSLGLSFGF